MPTVVLSTNTKFSPNSVRVFMSWMMWLGGQSGKPIRRHGPQPTGFQSVGRGAVRYCVPLSDCCTTPPRASRTSSRHPCITTGHRCQCIRYRLSVGCPGLLRGSCSAPSVRVARTPGTPSPRPLLDFSFALAPVRQTPYICTFYTPRNCCLERQPIPHYVPVLGRLRWALYVVWNWYSILSISNGRAVFWATFFSFRSSHFIAPGLVSTWTC